MNLGISRQESSIFGRNCRIEQLSRRANVSFHDTFRKDFRAGASYDRQNGVVSLWPGRQRKHMKWTYRSQQETAFQNCNLLAEFQFNFRIETDRD